VILLDFGQIEGVVIERFILICSIQEVVALLYPDLSCALAMWRLETHPERILSNNPTTNDLSDCPKSIREFKSQEAALPKELPRHYMVPSTYRRFVTSRAEFTVCSLSLPKNSFIEISEDYCVARPELVFIQYARYLELPLLIKLGCELCGYYSQLDDENGDPLTRSAPLMTVASLRRFIAQIPCYYGIKKARRALPYLLEGSASVRETEMALLMSLPLLLGGYGLPKPSMNYKIPFDRTALFISGASCAYADLCWPKSKLDVEYESDLHHSDAAELRRDRSRASAIQHMGYTVIPVTRAQYDDPEYFESLVKDIAKIIGARLRGPSARTLAVRPDLRALFEEQRYPGEVFCSELAPPDDSRKSEST
jgi:hypothetical protein